MTVRTKCRAAPGGLPSAGRRGIKAFDPNSIANLFAWWKADSGLTIVAATSCHWLDKVASKDEAQTTGANVPVLTASALNGHPAVTGDGVNDFVQANFTLTPPWTIIFVVRQLAAVGNACMLGGGDGTTTGALFFGTQPGGGNVRLFAAGAAEIDYLGDSTVGTTYVYSGSTSGTAQKLRTSGVNRASSAVTANVNLQGLRLFAAGDGAVPANAHIPEVLIYSRVLTDPESLTAERALGAYYGASVA